MDYSLASRQVMTQLLSPAADAVLDAYMANSGWLDGPLEKDYRCAAAVLRAVTDHVVPPALEEEFYNRNSPISGRLLKAIEIREELLAIADELRRRARSPIKGPSGGQ
jgi:hypothetical protein